MCKYAGHSSRLHTHVCIRNDILENPAPQECATLQSTLEELARQKLDADEQYQQEVRVLLCFISTDAEGI